MWHPVEVGVPSANNRRGTALLPAITGDHRKPPDMLKLGELGVAETVKLC
jgi:hypothetical protein